MIINKRYTPPKREVQKILIFDDNDLCRTLPEERCIKFPFSMIINYVSSCMRGGAKSFISQKLLNMLYSAREKMQKVLFLENY